MSLDPAKLVNLRPNGVTQSAQCPGCAQNGQDLSGKNHLKIFPDGAFGCVVDQSPAHYKLIWQLAGVESNGEISLTPPPEPQLRFAPVWSPDCLDRLLNDGSYWNGRGISDATLAPFRGGVATTGQLYGRYVFPMFNDDGDIVGFDARWTRPTPKQVPGRPKHKPWKILGESKSFLWGGIDEVGDTGRAILVESIGDSLMLREHGVPESLCLFGLSMSETILGFLITTNPKRMVISTNRDIDPRKGQAAAERIRKTLCKFFDEDRVTIVMPPKGVKDWGEATDEQIHAAFSEKPPMADDESADSCDTDEIDS